MKLSNQRKTIIIHNYDKRRQPFQLPEDKRFIDLLTPWPATLNPFIIINKTSEANDSPQKAKLKPLIKRNLRNLLTNKVSSTLPY